MTSSLRAMCQRSQAIEFRPGAGWTRSWSSVRPTSIWSESIGSGGVGQGRRVGVGVLVEQVVDQVHSAPLRDDRQDLVAVGIELWRGRSL